MKKIWEYVRPNHALHSEDNSFHISYNDFKSVGNNFLADNNGPETALVKDNQYFILNGDFRKEYEAVIDKGFNHCLKVFMDNIEHKSSWSD